MITFSKSSSPLHTGGHWSQSLLWAKTKILLWRWEESWGLKLNITLNINHPVGLMRRTWSVTDSSHSGWAMPTLNTARGWKWKAARGVVSLLTEWEQLEFCSAVDSRLSLCEASGETTSAGFTCSELTGRDHKKHEKTGLTAWAKQNFLLWFYQSKKWIQ